jgi:hypothetical protein
MKNPVTKVKISMDGLNNRMGKINEFKNGVIEITHLKNTEKTTVKNKTKATKTCGTIKEDLTFMPFKSEKRR